MATVDRNGRLYSYRSVRRGGRVTSVYRGAGELAERDAAEAARLAHVRRRLRDWGEALDADERAVLEMFRGVEAAAAAALADAGCHRPKRGPWRKSRART